MTMGTVFVIDDDAFFRNTLRLIFSTAGFAVDTFPGGREFLASGRSDADACLIVDLRMPDMGGIELLRHLREMRCDIPAIVYTGNADVECTVRAMREGAFTVIQKPFSNELMIEEVRQAIASARQQRTRNARLQAARASFDSLSERERLVAQVLAEGKSARETGAELNLSARTVEAHRANIFRKLGINSSAALVRIVLLAELGEVSAGQPNPSALLR